MHFRPPGSEATKKHKKKRHDEPLTDLEVILTKSDVLLKSGSDSASTILSRMSEEAKRGLTDGAIGSVILEFEQDLNFLSTKMPHELIDFKTS